MELKNTCADWLRTAALQQHFDSVQLMYPVPTTALELVLHERDHLPIMAATSDPSENV